jgi:precorrin-3B synthase
MANPVEVWKAEKHGFDVWPDVERYAAARTPMKDIEAPDLERMKWHGFFYRKRDSPGRYMNRIRVTANELTAEQAREVAYIAYEYGHGIVDVTTRANLQVQGLPIEHLPKFAERLEKVGLTSKQTGHDNIRNVFGHPFSGLTPDELFDTRRLCYDIVSFFLGNRVYSDLPRKFNIALDGSGRPTVHYWTQDISYLAARMDHGETRFAVLIGGTQGQNPHLGWHLPVVVEPAHMVAVTRALVDLFRTRGLRESRGAARFRYLIESIGVDGVLDWLRERLPFRLQTCSVEPAPASRYDELIGWFRQNEAELWTMGLCVPLGRLSWQQLEGLAVLSRKWADGHLRTTPEQGIAIINIPAGFRDAAATAAAALGLGIEADSLERSTMACTGSQFCNIAVTETKGHMFQLIEKLRKKAVKLHGIRIHMSGCPSSCAQHFTADIGLKGVRVRRLLGTREGFDVFLGGGIAGAVHMALPYRLGVDVDQLPTVVEEVVREYYLRREPGQTFSAYWRERLVATTAAKVGDGEYHPPVWVCDNCNFHHDGEDPPVFCPSCAGLRRNFARVPDGQATEEETPPRTREGGFYFAAKVAAFAESSAITVQIFGREYAIFRVADQFHAIDGICPHAGGRLSDGSIIGEVVTCPLHGWTFNVCSGCSVKPRGRDVASFPTLVEDGEIFLKIGANEPAGT